MIFFFIIKPKYFPNFRIFFSETENAIFRPSNWVIISFSYIHILIIKEIVVCTPHLKSLAEKTSACPFPANYQKQQQRQLQANCSAAEMATENVSAGEKQSTYTIEQIYHCSSDITAGIHGQLKFLSALNSFLSFTAFLGNALILVALRKESSLHPPSKHLLRCLATTDLSVGLIVEPLCVTLFLIIVNEHWSLCRYVVVLLATVSYILCALSLLILTAISVDRLFALLLGLRYRQVVTMKRVYLITITFCVVSTACPTVTLYDAMVHGDSCFTVSSNLDLLSHEDFLHPPSSSTSSTRPCWTTEPSKSTEHSAIQKRSVHCNVAAIHVSHLLSTTFDICNTAHSCWTIAISFSHLELYRNFSFLKLVFKPDSLLLEDGRSQTSSKGHNKTSILRCIDLVLVHLDQHLVYHQEKNDS